MDAIEHLINSPHKGEFFIACVCAIVAVQFVVKLMDWFRERFGITTASSRREKE